MVEIKNLSKKYNEKILFSNFNLLIDKKVFGIMGKSGSGKTTLLRMILGLEMPDLGEIIFSDNERLSAAFQEDRLLLHLNGKDNLKFVLGSEYDENKAVDLLKKLGINEEDGLKTLEYSGGMKRRLSIARALLKESDVVVLDEPFIGLDYESKNKTTECILEYLGDRKLIIVTHSNEDILKLSGFVFNI